MSSRRRVPRPRVIVARHAARIAAAARRPRAKGARGPSMPMMDRRRGSRSREPEGHARIGRPEGCRETRRRPDNVAPPIRDGCHCRRSFAPRRRRRTLIVRRVETRQRAFDSARSRESLV